MRETKAFQIDIKFSLLVQSEYVAPEHKRREYISGFSGSSLGNNSVLM